MLADLRLFAGDVGEFTVTGGRELGVESEVVETGRCRILELRCGGRRPGGPAVVESGDTWTVQVVDHGDEIRGMSSEARSNF